MDKRSSENCDLIRGNLYGAVLQKNNASMPTSFVKALETLKKDESIHITEEDKTNQIVIMSKCDYQDEVCDMLCDTNTYVEVKSNPVEQLN